MVTETKIDESFPTSQFIIPGLTSPYRFGRTKDGDKDGYLSILGKTSLQNF